MSKTDTDIDIDAQIESLEEEFRQFRDENKPFTWDTRIIDSKGYEATILVDFGISDYEEGIYDIAHVWAFGDNNPSDDEEEKIRSSEAFKIASKILEEASRKITKDGYPDCEFNVSYENGDIVVENIYTIFWGE